jgi:hypothetical protein
LLKFPSLKKFHNYFAKKWINSKFCNWTVFHSPPSYTTTNNPIESYNKTIKAFFTNRLKVNLIPAFKVFSELIHFESSVDFNYKTSVLVTKTEENKAKKLIASKFVKIGNLYNYTHKNGTISTISCVDNSCSCQFYADKATCLHLVRVALIGKKDLPGMNIQITFSIYKRRKLETKKVAAFEIDEDEFCMNDDDTESDNNDYNDGNFRYRSDIVGTARDENNDNETDDDKDVDVDKVVTTARITKTTTVEPLKKR